MELGSHEALEEKLGYLPVPLVSLSSGPEQGLEKMSLLPFFFLIFLAVLCDTQDPSSPTRGQTCASCNGSSES